MARQMERLGEAGLVPFVRKTYEMVSDQATGLVVSWGSSRDSFVVWDEHEFSKQVLPQYFKHSQLLQLHQAAQHLGSSTLNLLFIVPTDNPRGKEATIQGTPLATFAQGFKKIDSDRFEFANDCFQRGKKHLMKNIKRRGKFSNHRKPWSSTVTLDYPKAGKEAELETPKIDLEAMKTEILKLREEWENLRYEINQVAKRIRYVECRNRQMFLFLSKAAKSPNFVQNLIKKRRQKRELEICESSKKSTLLGPDGEVTKCLLEVMDHKIQSPNVDYSAQMESGPNNVVPKDFVTIQMHDRASERSQNPPMGAGDFRFVQGQTPNQVAGASTSDLPSVFHEISEKLLGDNVAVGDGAEDVEAEEELAMEDTGIYLELKGLIEKSCGWSEYTSELGEQAAD